MYKVINIENYPKRKQYEWFRTFSNPCYGINYKMDVTEVVKFSKETKTSFFVNVLYLICKGLSMVDEMRMREVNNEIRLYDVINPSYTVMTDSGVYENSVVKMEDDYKSFYKIVKEDVELVKHHKKVNVEFNSQKYNEYYCSCLPWLEMDSLCQPMPDNNYESSSCPRVVWDKYRLENGRYVMILNITVSHCFVDGYPLSCAFKNVQNNFDNAINLLK